MILSLFFSSRRRHTRLTCDWSSDVCSSDLGADALLQFGSDDAEPVPPGPGHPEHAHAARAGEPLAAGGVDRVGAARSEEHTSELQSHVNLVCRLLLEKKK